jgi:hypothetical protein
VSKRLVLGPPVVKTKWEVVDRHSGRMDRSGSKTQRLKVPGGWLYARWSYEGDYDSHESMVFVPSQPRKSRSSEKLVFAPSQRKGSNGYDF